MTATPHTGEVLLPTEQSRLVGRSAVLDQLLRHVTAPSAIVTLVGPGGMGKTRLALRALYLLAESGTPSWFCELAHATDPSAIAARLLSVAQIPVPPDVDETILAGRRIEREGDVFGMTVNIAARLSDEAPDGELYVVGSMVASLTAAGYRCERVRAAELHGVGQVELFRVER